MVIRAYCIYTGHVVVHSRSSQTHQPQVSCQSNDVIAPGSHIRPVAAVPVAASGPGPTPLVELRSADSARQVSNRCLAAQPRSVHPTELQTQFWVKLLGSA